MFFRVGGHAPEGLVALYVRTDGERFDAGFTAIRGGQLSFVHGTGIVDCDVRASPREIQTHGTAGTNAPARDYDTFSFEFHLHLLTDARSCCVFGFACSNPVNARIPPEAFSGYRQAKRRACGNPRLPAPYRK
jgi:hypothetical protein